MQDNIWSPELWSKRGMKVTEWKEELEWAENDLHNDSVTSSRFDGLRQERSNRELADLYETHCTKMNSDIFL